MNFFSGYGREKKRSYKNQMVAGAILIVIVTALALSTVDLLENRGKWDASITALEFELALASQAKGTLDETMLLLDATQDVYDVLEATDIALGEVTIFTAEDYRTIVMAIPDGVAISAIVITPPVVSITGGIDCMQTLPSLMQNLEATGLFDSIATANVVLNQQALRDRGIDISLQLPSETLQTGVSIPGFSLVLHTYDNAFSIECTLKGASLK